MESEASKISNSDQNLRALNINRLEKSIPETRQEVTHLLLERSYCPHNQVIYLAGQKQTCKEVDQTVQLLVSDIHSKSTTLERSVQKLSKERDFLRGKVQIAEERLAQLHSILVGQ